MSNMEIIVFAGTKKSGKDYAAEEYIKMGYNKLAFADGIYEEVSQELGISLETNEEKEIFKSSIIEVKLLNKSICLTGRQVLQNKGESRRKIDVFYWIKQVDSKISRIKKDNYVITDLRQLEEFNYIFNLKNFKIPLKLKVVFCNFESEKRDLTDIHESEKFCQFLIKEGLKHRQEITLHDYVNLRNKYTHTPHTAF